MGPDTLKHLFGLLIPILGLMIPIIAIVGGIRMKMQREALLHDTLRQLAERGQPIPAELLSGRLGDARSREWTTRSLRRFAVFNLAGGLGLMLMFWQMWPEGWLWSIGLVPALVGVSMLGLSRLEEKTPLPPVNTL